MPLLAASPGERSPERVRPLTDDDEHALAQAVALLTTDFSPVPERTGEDMTKIREAVAEYWFKPVSFVPYRPSSFLS